MNNKLLPFLVEGKIDTEALGAKYSWKPLSKAIAEEAMEHYKTNLPSGASVDGDKISLFTKKGALICRGYERIVIGHYGAYVEFNHLQANKDDFVTKPGQEYRELPKYAATKYLWYCHKDDPDIKIYLQKGLVGYADYRLGMYYVDVDSVAAVTIKQKEALAHIATAPPTITLAVTGHRPDKLGRDGGYDILDPSYDDIKDFFRDVLDLCSAKYGAGHVTLINGGALGADQISALVALEKETTLFTYIPFPGQEGPWKSYKDVARYFDILLKSKRVVDCSEGANHFSKHDVFDLMQKRNERMVDDADLVIAIFDGNKSGGTYKCVRYAIEKGRRVICYNPITKKKDNDFHFKE